MGYQTGGADLQEDEMKKIALVVGVIAWTLTPAAQAAIRTTLEPIIGYERVQILRPDPHSTNRMFYGGRLTVGSNIFALEAEYTRAELEETFPDVDTTTKSMADKAKAGLRGGFALGRLLRMNLRAGAQASKESIDVTTRGSTSRTNVPITYDPYGGAGFKLMLTPKTSLSAEVVAVFKDFPSMSGNEYQTSAGFAISLP
jgi:hypothetical protein